jgi:hypothetical protein
MWHGVDDDADRNVQKPTYERKWAPAAADTSDDDGANDAIATVNTVEHGAALPGLKGLKEYPICDLLLLGVMSLLIISIIVYVCVHYATFF